MTDNPDVDRADARHALGRALHLAYQALNNAPQACPYHGSDFERSGMAWGEPRCESCRQPYRVCLAVEALDTIQLRDVAVTVHIRQPEETADV